MEKRDNYDVHRKITAVEEFIKGNPVNPEEKPLFRLLRKSVNKDFYSTITTLFKAIVALPVPGYEGLKTKNEKERISQELFNQSYTSINKTNEAIDYTDSPLLSILNGFFGSDLKGVILSNSFTKDYFAPTPPHSRIKSFESIVTKESSHTNTIELLESYLQKKELSEEHQSNVYSILLFYTAILDLFNFPFSSDIDLTVLVKPSERRNTLDHRQLTQKISDEFQKINFEEMYLLEVPDFSESTSKLFYPLAERIITFPKKDLSEAKEIIEPLYVVSQILQKFNLGNQSIDYSRFLGENENHSDLYVNPKDLMNLTLRRIYKNTSSFGGVFLTAQNGHLKKINPKSAIIFTKDEEIKKAFNNLNQKENPSQEASRNTGFFGTLNNEPGLKKNRSPLITNFLSLIG